MHYRGRIAPTPTGLLHLGHARTFWIACERARQHGGTIVFRNEYLDASRCKPEFVAAMFDDLRWIGLDWQEGPDVGGPFAPYTQSERQAWYLKVWQRLHASGLIYPSPHSRADVEAALTAPHESGDEPIFPTALRPEGVSCQGSGVSEAGQAAPGEVNWRFLVPDGRSISFVDGRVGTVTRTAGVDFGDFLVWRKDGFPSYELAVVADDHAMQISDVVRGEDLLTSTARQLLLYEALGWSPPTWFHCELMRDEHGMRLAKRSKSLSLRALRESGADPTQWTNTWKIT